MTRTFDLAFSREAFLAAAERLAPRRPSNPGIRALTPFLDQYRADAFAEDFADLSVDDGAWLALDLWDLNLANLDNDQRIVRVRPATGPKGAALPVDVAEMVGVDAAFLVDTAIIACQDAHAEIRGALHPVVDGPNGKRSLIQIQLAPMNDAQRADLTEKLQTAFADVDVVNADFPALKAKMAACADAIGQQKAVPGRSAEDIEEARSFLAWLAADNFTFLGARDYTLALGEKGELIAEEPIVDPTSGLGVLRDPARRVLSRTAEPTMITPTVRAFLNEPTPLIIAKASFISRVHRRTHADYVGVKRYDENGEVVGETRFVGLFAANAYTRMACDVPLIRRKIARVKANFDGNGSRFSERVLDAVLQTFPRDELFQASEDELARTTLGVMHLQLRPRTKLFIRRDRFDRYVSALLYTPRDSYSSDLRARAHQLLADAYGGRTSAFYTSFNEGALARVHFIVGLSPNHREPDEDKLDAQMRQLFESWEQALERAARNAGVEPPSEGMRFSAGYKEAFPAEEALADLQAIAALTPETVLGVRAWSPDATPNISRCRIYHRDHALDLSDIVPVLEHMGLRTLAEVGYPIRLERYDTGGGQMVVVHDLTIERLPGQRKLDARFEQAFQAVWARDTENDGFNALVIALGIDWRQAALLRTLCRWRTQTGLDPSETVQIAALREHPDVALEILKLFSFRFDPSMPGDVEARRHAAGPVNTRIDALIDGVASADHDRVLRRLASLVRALVRTNFYQLDEQGRPYRHIAVKIASREAEATPAPQPYREIFVWSPDVEGVHLRFGPVARGGLRWSDRRDDFRTEVLGLVKAQQVKNAVIVPVGAKGGFFSKTKAAGREAQMSAGVAAYRTFVSALLDLTDNLVRGQTQPPGRTVIWDPNDPYLVVAADKGTATFSDLANGIAAEHQFWLGDAFASGGSVGYDHKAMGITARGAWVAVSRHFREMGRDIQTEPFTVAGVGDMSGDVFGNGMLLSKQIKLVAAFDHRHIFIDPNPADPNVSWAERKRLFDLPRSSWDDYDKSLISRGGGVYARSLKSIPLNADVRALLGLEHDAIDPESLIRAILKSPVDLLWFGGVGAFIKGTAQSHAEVGDKANEGLRINASEVRAKVIGEGANLGVTQAGRIEFARQGGRINTDAIDNSAGVDCSDHEVNIKILLTEAIATGKLPAEKRDPLLAAMTDEVGELVLANNTDQTLALSIMEQTAAADLDAHERFIEMLEARGRLDRALEGLPSAEEFRARRMIKQGLTRPELAVVMAYAKLDMFNALMETTTPEDACFEGLLTDYFPKELKSFKEAAQRHRLRREIVATRLANRTVNLVGPTFVLAAVEGEGFDAGRMVQAIEAARAIFGLDALVERVCALDGAVPAAAQLAMLVETAANLRVLASGFVSATQAIERDATGVLIERYRARVAEVGALLPRSLSPLVMERVEARATRYRNAGAPADLAFDVAMIRALASAREIVDIASGTKWPLPAATYVHHAVGETLGLDRMRAAVRDFSPQDPWDRLALQRIADDLPHRQTELTIDCIVFAKGERTAVNRIDRSGALRLVRDWLGTRKTSADRLMEPMNAFDRQGQWSLAKLVLLGDALRDFVYACKSQTAADAANQD